MRVDNAIIMAAGTSSRFVPLSYEIHKALINVKGEVLIERQIRQLQEAGIEQIIIVTGYRAEDFEYLKEKYNVELVHNPDYLTRNNNASIYHVKDYLHNSYVCSADNYFMGNPFRREEEESFYATMYAEGMTKEWCVKTDRDGYINDVMIGGRNSWYMLGHTFWSEKFSRDFLNILEESYRMPGAADMLWESIYIEHLNELKMKTKKYTEDYILEFDTLDELREFDSRYVDDPGSKILKDISEKLKVEIRHMHHFTVQKDSEKNVIGFGFMASGKEYSYGFETKEVQENDIIFCS